MPHHGEKSEPKSETLSNEVYRHLENEIMAGRLTGGSRLVLRQIAEEVNTSIIPVRDAINRLQEEGLVQSEPYKGATVKNFSTAELLENYEMRLLLEGEAILRGTSRISEEGIQRIDGYRLDIEQALAEERFGDAAKIDVVLYRSFYEFAGNRLLMQMIEALWKQSHLYRMTASFHREQLIPSQNARIIAAVKVRDAEEAALGRRSAIQGALEQLAKLERP